MRYEVFVLADSKGMTYDFLSYMGSIQPVNAENVSDLNASANSVLYLAQSILNNHDCLLYFNIWFTFTSLMHHLATREIWCCGTVCVSHISEIKIGKTHDKDLMEKGRCL